MKNFPKFIKYLIALNALLTIMMAGTSNAAPCSQVTGGADASISSSCENLVLDSAGEVTINSGVVISGDLAILNSTNTPTQTLNINGSVTSGNSEVGLYLQSGSSVTNLNLNGILSAGNSFGSTAVGLYIEYQSRTTNINNLIINGSISVGNGASAIINSGGVISLLENAGTISSGNANPTAPFGIVNDYEGLISHISNSNLITIGNGGVAINNTGSSVIGALINSGNILAGDTSIGIRNLNSSYIQSLTNSGSITVGDNDAFGIANINNSTISTLINSGSITVGDNDAFGIFNNGSVINVITNTGAISAGASGIGVYNFNGGTISNLNNLQGGNSSSSATTALTYNGVLPTSYNIIVSSPTHYGQLEVTSPSGATTFSIYNTSVLAKGTYASVFSGITSSNLNGATSGNYNGFTWSLNNSSGSIWDLIVTGASTVDTQQSLVNTASALRNTYALQNTVLINGFSYDCPVFDKNGICVSTGGRYSTTNTNSVSSTSALLIGAYRLSKQIRLGAYVDQNLSSSSNTVNLNNSNPMIGLFGVWNERKDGVGTEVKVSAGYGAKDATITRQLVGTSEAGSGSSSLNTTGAQITAKYGFTAMDKTIISPYIGIRYTQNRMNGYVEASNSNVTAPLTYSSLNADATTAIAGVGVKYQLDSAVALMASAGIENDLNINNGTYSATGITGLTAINFNANPAKTRATVSAGAHYDIDKRQRISLAGIYREESYRPVNTAAVFANYIVGF